MSNKIAKYKRAKTLEKIEADLNYYAISKNTNTGIYSQKWIDKLFVHIEKCYPKNLPSPFIQRSAFGIKFDWGNDDKDYNSWFFSLKIDYKIVTPERYFKKAQVYLIDWNDTYLSYKNIDITSDRGWKQVSDFYAGRHECECAGECEF